MECECAAAVMSGRASCSVEWIAKAAPLMLPFPSTTSPRELTRSRSETRMWEKLMPNGFTQKWSSRSGSRAVMWPATPSSNPNLPKRRNPAARRCLRCWRSSSTVSYFGRYHRGSRAMVSLSVSVIGRSSCVRATPTRVVTGAVAFGGPRGGGRPPRGGVGGGGGGGGGGPRPRRGGGGGGGGRRGRRGGGGRGRRAPPRTRPWPAPPPATRHRRPP